MAESVKTFKDVPAGQTRIMLDRTRSMKSTSVIHKLAGLALFITCATGEVALHAHESLPAAEPQTQAKAKPILPEADVPKLVVHGISARAKISYRK